MAIVRDTPYGQCNFLVSLGDGTEGTAGFSEVTLPTGQIDVIEYRSGSSKIPETIKLPGRVHVSTVLLKRGITGDLGLYTWWNAAKNGDSNVKRAVTIQLLNDERVPVMSWRLKNAWPVAYESPTLNAKGSEIAIEAIELAFDSFEIE